MNENRQPDLKVRPEDYEIVAPNDMYFDFSLNINKILNQIASQIKLESPYFFDKEDPLEKLEYMRDGLSLLKEVIENFYNLDKDVVNKIIDLSENCVSKEIFEKELANLSKILRNLFVIKYMENMNDIPNVNITKRDILMYRLEFENMGTDKIIKEINDTINSINMFINGNISEYFNNPEKMKDILVKWLFFGNLILDYKYYMKKSIFFDRIPYYIFYSIKNNNIINIEKIKSIKSMIEQLIKFQFKYFPYLFKDRLHLSETRGKIYDKMEILICDYIIYFLLLRAIENKKGDFIGFYYSILYYYYNNEKFHKYVRALLGRFFRNLKKESLEVPKMPDFSKINISDEDFLFNIVSEFYVDGRCFILPALLAYKEMSGIKGELSNDEKIEFIRLYIEKLDSKDYPVLYLLKKIESKKLKKRAIRILAETEDVSKQIEIPLIPIEDKEEELVKI